MTTTYTINELGIRKLRGEKFYYNVYHPYGVIEFEDDCPLKAMERAQEWWVDQCAENNTSGWQQMILIAVPYDEEEEIPVKTFIVECEDAGTDREQHAYYGV